MISDLEHEPMYLSHHRCWFSFWELDAAGCARPRRYQPFIKLTDVRARVQDLLGPTLEDLWILCNRTFTPRTVTLLADHLVRTCSSHGATSGCEARISSR